MPIIRSHTLEVVFPEQDVDELNNEFYKIVEQVEKLYEPYWLYFNSNQIFHIWRKVAMWFAEKHWGVIVVEDWMEYHGWQYLYERNGKRFKREVVTYD